MGAAGFLFAYIGAFVRWIFKGRRVSFNEILNGKESKELFGNFGHSWLNIIVGMFTCLLIIFIIGTLLNK